MSINRAGVSNRAASSGCTSATLKALPTSPLANSTAAVCAASGEYVSLRYGDLVSNDFLGVADSFPMFGNAAFGFSDFPQCARGG